MPPSGLKPHSGRYLTFAEREEIAICRVYGFGIREIARHLGRSASTISRELRRNAATRGGTLHYRAVVAQFKVDPGGLNLHPVKACPRTAGDFTSCSARDRPQKLVAAAAG